MQRLSVFRSRFFWKLYLTFAIPTIFITAVICLWVPHRIHLLQMMMPPSALTEQAGTIADTVYVFASVGIALALVLGLFLVRRVTIPITEIMRVCKAMRGGIYDQKVKTLPHDEVGILGDTLNRLGEEITKKIETISVERAQLKTVLAGMVEGIIAIDNDDRIQFCNRAAYRLLNSDLSDCRGMKIHQTPAFDRLKDVADLARRSMELVEKELSIENSTPERILETYATPFSRAKSSGVIIVLHDITKLRKLERIRRDFVANVSHEIKTPLTAIKGYTETLLSGALDDQENSRRFIEKVDRNANRLGTLVQDFLSLARIESQEEGINVRPTNWAPIVRQVTNQYEDELRKKQLTLEVKDEPSKPLVVLGEKESMHQVLDNLVTNAIRYTQNGGRITIKLKRADDLGVVEVEDTGIGIPEKHLDRIFERFYRVDKARSREVGGTGLGLSIVRHLVDGMNGQVQVASALGQGSKFSVVLSLSKVN